MKKKTLIAAILSLTLVLGACGGTKTDVADNHATNTEITTEMVADKDATEIIGATEDALNSDVAENATEIVDKSEVATDVVAKEDNDKNTGNKTDDTDKKNQENGSNNTGSNNSGSTGNSSNAGNTGNNAGNNSGTGNGNNGNGSTGSNTNKPVDTEKDTEKPVDTEKDTEKPVESTECKHINTKIAIGGGDFVHRIICKDCNAMLGTEPCDFTGGSCKCGAACGHDRSITQSSDESRDGKCGFKCNDCGFSSYLSHEIYVDYDNQEKCGRCGRVFPCQHLKTYYWPSKVAGCHSVCCVYCDAVLSDDPHSYTNGKCVCGANEPAPPETEAPAPPVDTENPGNDTEAPVVPVEEDGVTSKEVTTLWLIICRNR